MTVSNRYGKLQQLGCMSVWKLVVNPSFFGYRMLDVMVDVEPEFAKADMIKKLKLIHGVTVLINFYGKALKVILVYDSEDSRSRTLELISRITNTESLTIYRIALPRSETKRLTETDVAILESLADDARKPAALVAKEIGSPARTVKSRVEKLRKEKTLFTLPNLSLGDIPGLITAYISYSYTDASVKTTVDRALLSRFDPNFLWGGFADSDNGFLVLNAPAMTDVQKFLDWTREQPGVARARVDIPMELISLPQKFRELLTVEERPVGMG